MIKNILFISRVGILAFLGISCSTPSVRNNEISLKADRSALQEFRQDISDSTKEENDFVALVLKDMSDLKLTPSEVRDRYNREVRKTREKFTRNQKKAREQFNSQEKKNREKFLANLKSERESFIAGKPKSNESSYFFQEQNNKRQSFFQDQSDARRDFDSEMSQIRDDFNEDMRLKQKQFDDAYREYSKEYQDKIKEKREIEKNKIKAQESGSAASYQNGRLDQMNMQNSQEPSGVKMSYPGQEQDLQELRNMKAGQRQQLGTDGE